MKSTDLKIFENFLNYLFVAVLCFKRKETYVSKTIF